jgi:hypothetical protein
MIAAILPQEPARFITISGIAVAVVQWEESLSSPPCMSTQGFVIECSSTYRFVLLSINLNQEGINRATRVIRITLYSSGAATTTSYRLVRRFVCPQPHVKLPSSWIVDNDVFCRRHLLASTHLKVSSSILMAVEPRRQSDRFCYSS